MGVKYTDDQLKAAVILLRKRGTSFSDIMYFVHELDASCRSATVKEWLIDAGVWKRPGRY